jgi:DDE superfamily endonuclease
VNQDARFPPECIKVDFSRLETKGVGYAPHRSRLKEVIELRTLPPKMVRVLASFAPLFSKRVFQHAQLLLVGAILAPGRRTVGSALRAMGLDRFERFHRYHRVLSRARWSSLEASRILLGVLLEAFVGEGPLILGIDETLERRYGKKISARGVYRDPVRSTHETFVKSSGLRWVCAMLLVEVPFRFSGMGLAFPLGSGSLRALCRPAGQRSHKKISEWAWQLLLVLRRWYPQREIVTGDASVFVKVPKSRVCLRTVK